MNVLCPSSANTALVSGISVVLFTKPTINASRVGNVFSTPGLASEPNADADETSCHLPGKQ
jgi:hypothetical protein